MLWLWWEIMHLLAFLLVISPPAWLWPRKLLPHSSHTTNANTGIYKIYLHTMHYQVMLTSSVETNEKGYFYCDRCQLHWVNATEGKIALNAHMATARWRPYSQHAKSVPLNPVLPKVIIQRMHWCSCRKQTYLYKGVKTLKHVLNGQKKVGVNEKIENQAFSLMAC